MYSEWRTPIEYLGTEGWWKKDYLYCVIRVCIYLVDFDELGLVRARPRLLGFVAGHEAPGQHRKLGRLALVGVLLNDAEKMIY